MTEYKKVFIDTAPFIYALENNPEYCGRTQAFLARCFENDIQMTTSVVTVEEYYVGAYRLKLTGLIEKFKNFLYDLNISVVPIEYGIAERAAYIRGEYESFKGMDALQLATAQNFGCDTFLTNDKRLQRFDGLNIILIDSL